MFRCIPLSLVLGFSLVTGDPTSCEIIPDQCELSIKTLSLADRETRKLRLNNGLKVYLISDPDAEQSAAALVVEVGSWQDPDNRPGLAHFVEHMVFMGTETYPVENEFDRVTRDHGGQLNAYTSDRMTTYLFAINHEGFPDSLNRFAHFFIDPLFAERSMAREQQAVHSEFVKASEDEAWRLQTVRKVIANPHHPIYRFAAGNLQTLEGVTHEEMAQWFENHYSANLMHLVVYSSLPLDLLQDMAVEDFSSIPNRDYNAYTIPERQLGESALGQILFVKPRQNHRQLGLAWEIPYNHGDDLETRAAELVSFVLGHEGEGSLCAYLKGKGWAEELATTTMAHRKEGEPTQLFQLSVRLTPEGLQAYDQVAEACFQAIRGLQQTGVPAYIFEENCTLQRIGYEYSTRQVAFETVDWHARHLPFESLTTYPMHTLLPSRYDRWAMQSVLEELTPGNCQITLMAQNSESGGKTPLHEPWMNVEYGLQGPTSTESHAWDKARPHPEIILPAPNPFVPHDLEVYRQQRSSDALPKPQLLSESPYGTIYYAPDELFLVPQIAWTFIIKSEATAEPDAETAVLLDLLTRSLSERLNSINYTAAMGGLSFQLSPHLYGLKLALNGYSEKGQVLLQDIVTAFNHGPPTEAEFERYRTSLMTDYQNMAKEQPLTQAIELVSQVVVHEGATASEEVQAIQELSYHQFVSFVQQFRQKTYIQGMIFGNTTLTQAEQVIQLLQNNLQQAPYPDGRNLRPRVVSLPKNKNPHFLLKTIKSQGNATVLMIQEGPFTFKRRAAQEILGAGMKEPFFTELRAKQQTGYVVTSWAQEIERQLFQAFAVQSSSYDGRDLLARFELFIETFLRDLSSETLPEDRFEQLKHMLITRHRQGPKNPTEMSAYLTTLAFKYDGDFDWKLQRLRGLETLTYPEFIVLAKEFLGRQNRRRFAVIARGKLQGDEALTYKRARSPNRLKRVSGYATRHKMD